MDKSQYDAGLDDAAKGAQTFGDKLKQGLGTAAKVGATAIAAVGTAAAAATTALVKQAGEVASYGDNIDKASQKLGISAEAYQEWDAVLQHSGTSIDSMGIGMKTLANAAASGSDAFTALGISAEQAASMSREDLFAQTITALQNVTDENKRAQLAQELFGRSAMELGPLLNTSAAETQAMRDKVNELGGVLSDQAVKAAAKYQDSLQDLQTSLAGTKRSIMADFLPGITSVMDGLSALMTGGANADKFINQGVSWISEAFERTVDKLTDLFDTIVPALVKAITKALPTLLNGAAKLVLTITQAVLDNLPMLIEAGLQVIVTLAQGIAENLPTMIPAIVDIILKIVDVLTQPDTLSALIDAAIAIIIALANGLIDAIPRLIEAVPTIMQNLLAAIIQNAPKLLAAGVQLIAALAKGIVQSVGSIVTAIGNIAKSIWDGIGNLVTAAWNWGADLINNFVDGIKAFISRPIDAIKGLAGKIKSFLGFSEPEEGPLSNFHTYAPDMMQLFAKGITDNSSIITDAIGKTFNLAPTIQAQTPAGREVVVPRGGGSVGVRSAEMVVDRAAFARVIFRLYNEEAARVGVQLSGVTY